MRYRIKEEIKNDTLTERIIAVCFKVHNALGAGVNEKIYKKALRVALESGLLKCDTEKR